MTDPIIAPEPKRDAAAAALAQDVERWPFYTLKVAVGAFPAGTQFRRAPSSRGDGTRYLVNAVACECPDYQRAGNVCKHVRAIRLAERHEYEVEQAFADVAAKPRKTYADLFPVSDFA